MPEEVDLGSNLRNFRDSRDLLVNRKGRQFLEFCEEYGLTILNGRTLGDFEGKITYIGGNGSSVNDIAAISYNLTTYGNKVSVGDEVYSDHFPISLFLDSCEFSYLQPNNLLKLLPKLNWKLQDINEYKNKVINLCEITPIDNVENKIETLVDIILKSSRHTQKNFVAYKQKWFDSECFRSRKLSFKWLSIFRKTCSETARDMYLNINKEYKRLCVRKKRDYHENLAESLDTVQDSGTWWRIAGELREKKFVIGTQISINTFSNYFQSLLNPCVDTAPILYASPNTTDPLLDRQIEMYELTAVLEILKDNKAPGIDRVPYEFYKNAPSLFLQYLLKTFNDILVSAEMPDCFKRSVLFPIYKKGDVNRPENYRGLSFMDAVGKIFVGIIYNRLSNWEQEHKILSESQAGFRRGYSTVNNIYNLISIINISDSLNKKKIYACFVDFKSAFDTIPRDKLLNRGVSSKIIHIWRELYKDTKAQIWNGTRLPSTFNTNSGIKQGCILSPLLFVLFIDHLVDYWGVGLIINNIEIKVLL